MLNEDDVVQFSYNECHRRLEVSDIVLAEPLHVPLFGAYTLAIYSKYFIVQRGIKSKFSVRANCQNLNILNSRKTIQELKTISDNVLTPYIFTIKGNSIDLSFQYTTRWQPVQSLQMRSWCI